MIHDAYFIERVPISDWDYLVFFHIPEIASDGGIAGLAQESDIVGDLTSILAGGVDLAELIVDHIDTAIGIEHQTVGTSEGRLESQERALIDHPDILAKPASHLGSGFIYQFAGKERLDLLRHLLGDNAGE